MCIRDRLYVGPATRRKLNRTGVYTIGELARCQRGMLRGLLGKWGETLWVFANGLDREPVAVLGDAAAAKSVGNSITTARDPVSYTHLPVPSHQPCGVPPALSARQERIAPAAARRSVQGLDLPRGAQNWRAVCHPGVPVLSLIHI